ncbi:MAG: DUF4278 domain-containing protein [Oscillatoriales cyanobacterium C42_A2020_001]|nr:DUF4278 domain-containing protein [Leptolyngbyaceae cyanobacterium C42_A2020_001]
MMELSYRGVRYQAAPSIAETIESHLVSKYRGVTMKLRYAQSSKSVPFSVALRYRGCQY